MTLIARPGCVKQTRKVIVFFSVTALRKLECGRVHLVWCRCECTFGTKEKINGDFISNETEPHGNVVPHACLLIWEMSRVHGSINKTFTDRPVGQRAVNPVLRGNLCSPVNIPVG